MLANDTVGRNSKFFRRWGGGELGLMFAGYVPLVSQSPYPILVYFLANYRPHLSHFCNFRDPNLVTFYLCIYLIDVVSSGGM